MWCLKGFILVISALLSVSTYASCPYITRPASERCTGLGVTSIRTNYHQAGTQLCHQGQHYVCSGNLWKVTGSCANSAFPLEQASQKESSQYDDINECTDANASIEPDSDDAPQQSDDWPEEEDLDEWFQQSSSESGNLWQKHQQRDSERPRNRSNPDFESQLQNHERRVSEAAARNWNSYNSEVAGQVANSVSSAISGTTSGSGSHGSMSGCANAESAIAELQAKRAQMSNFASSISASSPYRANEAKKVIRSIDSSISQLRAQCR